MSRTARGPRRGHDIANPSPPSCGAPPLRAHITIQSCSPLLQRGIINKDNSSNLLCTIMGTAESRFGVTGHAGQRIAVPPPASADTTGKCRVRGHGSKGFLDLSWRNAAAHPVYCGTQRTWGRATELSPNVVVDTDWKVKAVADFNQTHADLVCHHYT